MSTTSNAEVKHKHLLEQGAQEVLSGMSDADVLKHMKEAFLPKGRGPPRVFITHVLCLASALNDEAVRGERESGAVVSCLRPGTKKNELLLSFSEKLGQHLDIYVSFLNEHSINAAKAPLLVKSFKKSLNNHNFTSAKKEDKSRLDLVDDWRATTCLTGMGKTPSIRSPSSTRLSWAVSPPCLIS